MATKRIYLSRADAIDAIPAIRAEQMAGSAELSVYRVWDNIASGRDVYVVATTEDYAIRLAARFFGIRATDVSEKVDPDLLRRIERLSEIDKQRLIDHLTNGGKV